MSKYNPTITVCDKCYRACCWQGEFMCDNSYSAGTKEKTIELETLRNAYEAQKDGDIDWLPGMIKLKENQ